MKIRNDKRRKYERDWSKRPVGIFNAYRKRARRKGLAFDLTLEEFVRVLVCPCRFCGKKATGIDRIDSTRGYIPTNIQSCCFVCNTMKWTLTMEEFAAHVRRIAKRIKGI